MNRPGKTTSRASHNRSRRTLIRFERDFGVRWGAVFVGEDGRKIEINRGTVKSNPAELTAGAPPSSGGNANPHMQNWLDCIKTREDPIAPVEAGHRAVNLCHFINICRELGAFLTERWKASFPDAKTWIMWDVALIEALIRPELAGEEKVNTPPENRQRKVRMYRTIAADRMRADFWKAAMSSSRKTK